MDASNLKRFALFKDVEESALNKIAPYTMLVEFPEGKTIIQEGGFSNDFYAIDEGTARVERSGEEIATLGPGDVFGEQGLLEKQERSASVVATSTLRALKIEHWEIPRMRRAMPEVVEQLQRTVEERSS
ncbi:MAG: cyclic nucleotide-binding domain-containing protein [Solirubrobacterales bacterium]|nr:cyclic nucleotide-binding domain-containing protein [Solirubrobacterales bacterium]MCB8970492.1 cyclic nucleotide-binding domain-containing protein [Thermoleophilales bacterium]MCO5325655.1 cyclic nucleotide-binding domain-containing protein [Solirubrobacterales bacterium]